MAQILPPLVLPTQGPGTPTFPGEQGPPGPPGTNGTNGTNGADGAPGAPGENGAEGPQGPPGTGGGGNVFVYRPFDPEPATNVFVTFQEAYEAAIALGIPSTIIFDDHIDACYILAGTYDLSQITLSGFSTENTTAVFIQNASINRIHKITTRLSLVYDSSSAPAISIDGQDMGNGNQVVFVEDGAEITNIGTQPFYSVFNNGFFELHLLDNASIYNSGPTPVILIGDNCETSIVFEGLNTYLSEDAIQGGESAFIALSIRNASNDGVPDTLSNFDGFVGRDILAQLKYIRPYAGGTSERPTGDDNTLETGAMYYDYQISFPVWWDGSKWNEATRPYTPEHLHISIDAPQTTNLTSGSRVNFNTPLVNIGNGTYGGYSSPGVLYISFNDSREGPNYTNVSHKLVGNLGSFDGQITYQWWDNTNNIGVGNIGSNAGGGKSSDAIALIPDDYMLHQSVAVFLELRLLTVDGTTFIGEAVSGANVLPWATMESIGTPILN